VSKKIVMFDVDGVLAEFIGGFTARAARIFPGVPITYGRDQPSWNGFPGMTKPMISATWDSIRNDPAFWFDLSSLTTYEEEDRIRILCATQDVYFVTARHAGPSAKQQTEMWLQDRIGLQYPTVVLSTKKGEVAKAIGADFCIDDKASNASTVAWLTEDKTKSHLLDRPYNRVDPDFMASSVVRVSSVTEYLNIIEGVSVNG
jgi:5'(3')-deoxyribonucleotidase